MEVLHDGRLAASAGDRLPALPVLRLLVVTPGRIASTQIFDLVFQGLAEQGALEFRTVFDNESTPAEQQEAVLWADVVFFLRSFTQSSLALSRYARHHGRVVVYSTDDDFRELDPETPLGRLHLEPQTLEAYESLVAEADLVWLYTPEMQRRYAALSRRITIGRLPSFVEFNAPRTAAAIDPPEDDATLVVGYGGSSTHESDLRVVVRPLLAALDRWDHVRAQFINYAPAELARHPRVEVRPFMGNLLSYYEFLQKARWGLGLAPLRDDRFNRGKTSNKYREYAGLGIPGIYSNVPVYAEDVRHLETGWLADHDEDSFAAALDALIGDPALRRRIRIGSLQDASSRFSLRAMQMHFLREISRLAIDRRHLSWRRPRLVAVGYERTSSMQIGALQPLRRLEREGLVELHHVEPESASPAVLEGADVVLVMRAFEEVTLPLLDGARTRQVPVVASWDDDFLSIPPGTPIGDFYNHPSVVRAIRRYLAEASLVLASTPPLFARSAEHSSSVMEAIYGLDEESVPPPTEAAGATDRAAATAPGGRGAASAADGPVRIGFYGSNDALALPWMVEALRLLRARHGRAIEIEAIGIEPVAGLADLLDWVEPGVRGYAESLASLRSRGWAIGLAPLADSAFNSAKQATKFRDYAWAGVAMVCSKVPAYERVLLDGVHARFAEESPEDWAAVVSHLVERPGERDRLVRGARALLAQVHVQSLTDASWIQVLWRTGAARDAARVPLLESPKPIPSGEQEVVETLAELVGAEPAQYVPIGRRRRYRFVASRDSLAGVEVCIGSSSGDVPRGRLDFVLALDDGQAMRRGAAELGGTRSGTWVRFEFEEVLHSAGRGFTIDLALAPGGAGEVGVFESSRIGSPRVARAVRRLGFAPVVAAPFLRVLYSVRRRGEGFELESAERARAPGNASQVGSLPLEDPDRDVEIARGNLQP